MEFNRRYIFELANENKTRVFIKAISEESAKRKLKRRRGNHFRATRSAVSNATIVEVVDLVDESNVKVIFESLKVETTSFKKEYLKRMETFLSDEFDDIIEKYGDFKYEDWLREFGQDVNRYGNTRRVITKDGEKLKSKTYRFKTIFSKNGKDGYIKKELEFYSQDFDSKLFKLAGRMDDKGFTNDIKVTSKHVGVNFNCTVTDGNVTVTARTIIASGPIVRPHYRYLVR